MLANQTARDQSNNSALHLCSMYGYTDIAKLLVQYNADLESVNSYKKSALDEALYFGHVDIIKMPNPQNDGQNYKDWCSRKCVHEGICKPVPIEQYRNDERVKNEWCTGLHLAAHEGCCPAMNAYIDDVSINTLDQSGRTPLFYASHGRHNKDLCIKYDMSKGHPECWQILLSKDKIDVNVKDKDGQTALFYAARAGKYQICEALLDKGADINAADNNNQTALHHAAMRNQGLVIMTLINRGADFTVRDICDKTALDLAVKLKHNVTAEWIKHLCQVSALIFSNLRKEADAYIQGGEKTKPMSRLITFLFFNFWQYTFTVI